MPGPRRGTTAMSLMMNAVRNAPSNAGKAAGGAVDSGLFKLHKGLINAVKGTGSGVAGAPKALARTQLESGKMMLKTLAPMGMGIGKLAGLAKPTSIGGLPKKLLSKTMGMAGINLSVSSLLRQSQIFTGFMGALFQILGGFVDVILAPFMPFFVGLMKKLASWIPKVREYAQKAYEWLSKHVFPKLREWADFLAEKIRAVFGWALDMWPEVKAFAMSVWTTAQPILDGVWESLKSAWDWVKRVIWPPLLATAESLFTAVLDTWAWLESMWPSVENIFGNIVTIIETLAAWWEEKLLPRFNDFYKWVLEEVGSFYIWFIDTVVAKITEVLPTILSIIEKVWDIGFEGVIKPFWDAFEPILKWFIEFVMDVFQKIIEFVDKNVLPFISDMVDKVMPLFQEVSDLFMTHIAPKLEEVMDWVFDVLDKAWKFVEPWMSLIMDVLIWIARKIIIPILMDLFLSLYDVWKVVIAPAISWLFTHIFNWDNILKYVVNPIIGVVEWLVNKILDAVFFIIHWKEAFTFLYYKYINPVIAKMIDMLPGGDNDAFYKAELRRIEEHNKFNRMFLDRKQVEWGRGGLDKETNRFTFNIYNKDGAVDESREMVQETDKKARQQARADMEVMLGSQSSLSNIN